MQLFVSVMMMPSWACVKTLAASLSRDSAALRSVMSVNEKTRPMIWLAVSRRSRLAFEDAAVGQHQGIDRLDIVVGTDFVDPCAVGRRVAHAFGHEPENRRIVVRQQQVFRDLPQFRETAVHVENCAGTVFDQNAVGRGFERGPQAGAQVGEFLFGMLQLADR